LNQQDKKPSRFWLLPKREGTDPRISLLAGFIQLTLIAIIVPLFIVPVALDLLRDDAGGTIVPEEVSFQVMLPTDGPTERRPARAGGDDREAAETPVPPPEIVAPVSTPTAVPAAPAEPSDPLGVGPIVGGGGPTAGIRPSFTDSRLWVEPSNKILAPIVPLTRADTLELMLRSRVLALVDSMQALPPERRAGDWTRTIGGRKYGIDEQMIRVGPVSIPTAVLGLLPLNLQGNSMMMERARRLDSMREEIQMQASRSIRDDEFRKAVNALRERRERERRERAGSDSSGVR
jgi:hypothetical protein